MPEQSSREERGLRSDLGDRPDRSSLQRRSDPLRAGPNRREPLPRTTHGLAPLGTDFWHVVDEGLGALGLELGPGSRAALGEQARLLLAWNRSINLTALRTEEQIARAHILDSLSALHLLRRLGCERLLDLGSGAGYPGLPLAVSLPARRCALVESVGKKQAFLEVAASAAVEAITAAGGKPPVVEAIADRAEDLAEEPDQRESWEVVVARAVGSLAEVVELGLPLVSVGGHVVAWKRQAADGSLGHELQQAGRVLQAAGASRPRVEELPHLAAVGLPGHVLVVVRKVRATPDRYPRSPAERRRALLP